MTCIATAVPSYAAWLNGPAAPTFAITFTEEGDAMVLAAQVKYAKIRRAADKEDTFDATGTPFDLEEIGTYAERVLATHADAFQAGATAWMQEIIHGVPNRLRLTLTARFERIDDGIDGLATFFTLQGDGMPEGGLCGSTPQHLRATLLTVLASLPAR